ncbi:valine--tRNA ligase [Deinococcus soli (ex Cha et al. 2016)]|uniref:Valyl-tRNA synthetase n=2 Tax=Deinococcus soli (ex Cha et al. 2016) TaxID=1309411 RepID=A0ACC6KBI5_9DEIO|nr:valine--tRNA ligase [Deinococcus soli (ex Cha et al. 2016)]MDR6216725.1 valyl-tRNA synthetase [Deinococcus soli (ex Cha et al. 2016)]MDR6327546.1 valyl-tRNA synthetase [Deinococcus soli (ex Cha et al. 2016)]MDR6749821.1 valyl-tRNA synthetase [Deinococcus soli (ex Cha et al. 2016)]
MTDPHTPDQTITPDQTPENDASVLAKQFDPKAVEPGWAAKWRNEPFRADATSGKEPFTIVIPPPNVTGNLHLGHALDNTLIDTLIRYKRMAGFEALYLPGMDHAGISTQVVVERQLREQGVSRHDLGRERFLDQVWEWKAESGGMILEQLSRLGVSADWTRERFTMDEGLSRAVRHQFVKLYHEGFAYRGERIVNWDPASQTTLSELEIDREVRKGKMYTLSYRLRDPQAAASNGEAGEIRIATVRPETIFADQAIAVHPQDPRFAHLVGQEARIPLTDRYVPIIADEAVEMEFGVGALKITPAHDPTDFEVGERHGLARPSVIDLHGNLTRDELVPAEFQGLERFAARKAVVKALTEGGDLLEEKDHDTAIGLSERTKVPVEPIISEQWYVKMKPFAEQVLAGLERGEMQLVPERYAKVNRDWLENIRDWNISRQLWWGHQIPAWYDEQGNLYVPDPEQPDLDCDQDPRYAHLNLRRDPDVFDTWFSSNLWPFSTLGWPDTDSEDFRKFYPTQVLVTGYDILFFWVARMQMAGYGLTGQAPFSTVMLHGLYLDAKGQKMSKSKGNGIDPLELFDQYGVDASRFAFSFLSTGGQDIKHDPRRFEQGRNFANKLWNAARFAMLRLGEALPNLQTSGHEADEALIQYVQGALDDSVGETLRSRDALTAVRARADLTLADRWILSRLNAVTAEATAQLDAFDIGAAIRTLYSFTWDEFCDWYIEAAKPALSEGKLSTLVTLKATLEHILKLLHPFMPFVTSELYGALGHRRQLAVHSWPAADGALHDADATRAFDALRAAVAAARSLKSELGLSPQDRLNVAVEGDLAPTVHENARVVESIARVNLTNDLDGRTLSLVEQGVTVRAPLEGTVDIADWVGKQKKRLAEFDKQIKQAQGKLSNEGFVARAPAEVIEEEKRRVADFGAQRERLTQVLAQFE